MANGLPPPWGLTLQQLRELERSCRLLATKAISPQSVNLFLALSDRFKARASEREAELGEAREQDGSGSR